MLLATAASPSATRTRSKPSPAVLLAAGDIADCSSSGDEATASILDAEAGTVATLGDNVYESGTPQEFSQCYHPSWGRHRARTRPSPGNHDYYTPSAAGYFQYFGGAAGDPSKGYYSYDLGSWHIIVLNSVCAEVGGCDAGSSQERWLRADLAASPNSCTAAYWHHARFSSGPHGSNAAMQAFWEALYEAGADIVLSGHDHLYERFAPQTPRGTRDETYGIRQFTVGTGGRSLYQVASGAPNSEVVRTDTYGVLRLTLREGGYDWKFLPEAGKSFSDAGSGTCHNAPGSPSPPPGPPPGPPPPPAPPSPSPPPPPSAGPTPPATSSPLPADTTPPNTRISRRPSNPTPARWATFRFSSTEVGSRFRCRLDDRAWTSCSSPRTYRNLGVGLHTFRVAALDQAGNLDPTPAAWRWRVTKRP